MTVDFHRANKNPLGEWTVYHLLLLRGLRHAFGGVYVRVDPAALRLRHNQGYPLVFCLTHSGWFDGHLAALVNKRIYKQDAYLMMEEPNLARYWFFTWAGVFGIDRDDPRMALASIEYITDILKEPSQSTRALWMFPQGTMRHPDERPLKLFGGVANIARRVGKCAMVPVAIRYDFMMDQAPDAYIRFGPPLLYDSAANPPGSKELTERLRIAMETESDKLHSDMSHYARDSYRQILSGRGSINKMWDGVLKVIGNVKQMARGGR